MSQVTNDDKPPSGGIWLQLVSLFPCLNAHTDHQYHDRTPSTFVPREESIRFGKDNNRKTLGIDVDSIEIKSMPD